MGNPYVISGPRSKRARLAGKIAQAERTLAKLRRQLDTLDATINLFEPATNPELIPPQGNRIWAGVGIRRQSSGTALDPAS